MVISQLSMLVSPHLARLSPAPMAPFSRATITAVSRPWLVRPRNMRQPGISKLEIPNDLNLENTSTRSSNISETLLNHIQTGSWNWLLCRMRAVGVWRIIPRIRTGLKPFDHQPSPRLDPIVPLHQASLRLHNLPLPAVGEIPGTGGKTNDQNNRNLWELVEFVNRPSTGWERKKPLRPTTSDAGNQLGGKLVDAGGSALTATARTARHARFLELWLRLLARFLCGFNVRENSSMFGWAWLYCESRNTIHTVLEHSRFSSWHFLPLTMTIVTTVYLEQRMTEWVGWKNIKHYVRDYSSVGVFYCLDSGCKKQRMREPANDFGQRNRECYNTTGVHRKFSMSYHVDLQAHESMRT